MSDQFGELVYFAATVDQFPELVDGCDELGGGPGCRGGDDKDDGLLATG